MKTYHFGGSTFDAALDGERLTRQLDKVRAAMSQGGWWTLRALATFVEGSEAGVSARIRDLRKERNGGHTVDTRRGEGGVWFYRLVLPAKGQRDLFGDLRAAIREAHEDLDAAGFPPALKPYRKPAVREVTPEYVEALRRGEEP